MDKRYIRVHDKPLFIVYRPSLFDRQRFCRFVNILKKECRKAGISDIFILASNSFGFNQNPAKWNLNGIVEFPPHGIYPEVIDKDMVSDSAKITVSDAANFSDSM